MTGRSRWSKVASTWVTMVLATVVLLGAGSSRVLAADPQVGVFSGNAYGTFANASAGSLATTLGRSAPVVCPCQGTGGRTRTNTVDTLTAGTTLTAQQITNTAYGRKTATAATTHQTSTVEGLHFLNGLITADAMHAEARTVANASTIVSDVPNASFTNLKIGTTSIAARPAPNTRMDLAGIGYVILNEVVRGGNGVRTGSITNNMLHVFITESNSLGLRIGVEIIVAHAHSGYTRSQLQGIVRGFAYVASDTLRSGPIRNRVGRVAPVGIGCLGTYTRTITNTVNATSVGTILTSGTGTTTAFGGNTTEGTIARTTATVQQVNLLGGLIQAETVTAVAQSRVQAGVFSATTAGSGFVNLRVLGVRRANVAANTRVELPGIGYVILNEQTLISGPARASARIALIHIVVTTSNSFGLPVGQNLYVARAGSSVDPF